MMIQVVYTTGSHDMVKPHLLNRLLINGEISQFKRTTGWVKVGHDPIRKMRLENYPTAQDRRQREA